MHVEAELFVIRLFVIVKVCINKAAEKINISLWTRPCQGSQGVRTSSKIHALHCTIMSTLSFSPVCYSLRFFLGSFDASTRAFGAHLLQAHLSI